MSEMLKVIKIKHVRKDHQCNACLWLDPVMGEIKSGEIKMTISERKSIIRARNNGWRVKKGEPAIYCVGLTDGDFVAWYSIPEIDAICSKYELYCEW